MQIQANTVGTQAVAHYRDATTGGGRMGPLEARQVATGQDAILLGNRSEPQKGQGLLSRLGAQLARPFVAIKEWIGNLLGSGKSAAASKTQVAENLSMADQKRLFLQQALPYTLNALDKTSELKSINAEQLRKGHTTLATGNGALRSLVTALSGIRDGSKIEATTHQAARLLELNLGGIALQQWGTTGRQASEWVSSATQEQLGEVAAGLNDLMHEVAQLRYAVESEVKGEPADKALAEGLQDQFGLLAEQYLGERPHGLYSDAEVMALGIYTNGEYQPLNSSLRQEKQLDAGQALIDQGMSAAFEKSTPAEQLVKTFRGTHGGDAFSGVTEGQVGHDAAYFSTSRDPKVAIDFGGSGTISTVFGRSGVDVSDISIEGEQEILYNKATDMRVLLSAKDERGVTRRVLEEDRLGEQSGHSKGLLDALDLARGSGGADLLASATPELQQEAMSQLHTAMGEVTDLQRAVKAEIAGEPAQSATITADAAPVQSGESKGAAREQVAMARQTPATGYKLALDLISYQASYLLRDQTSTEVTLSSSDINALHQHIADGSINGSHMAKLQTRGDLQTLRTLALSLASGSDAKGSSLGHALDSLASARPNQRLVLGGLMQFASQGDQAWADHTAGKPEDRLDAGARLRFDTGHMQAELDRLGDSEARQVLQQLEGAFGDRARAICEFAVAQVSGFADSDSSPEGLLVSRLTRMDNLVGSLTDALKERLQLPGSARGEPTMIDSASQLTPLELAALAHIGVGESYL